VRELAEQIKYFIRCWCKIPVDVQQAQPIHSLFLHSQVDNVTVVVQAVRLYVYVSYFSITPSSWSAATPLFMYVGMARPRNCNGHHRDHPHQPNHAQAVEQRRSLDLIHTILNILFAPETFVSLTFCFFHIPLGRLRHNRALLLLLYSYSDYKPFVYIKWIAKPFHEKNTYR